MLHLIACLGNIGDEYAATRHNIGFRIADKLAADAGISFQDKRYGFVARMRVKNQELLLLKPSTYMNNSGLAVVEAMQFYKIPPERVIVIFDDISLDVGKLRIRRKGSDGGHNGIKNIIYLSGSDQFPRIERGIGHKPEKWQLADWVLSHFTESEYKLLNETAEKAVQAAELMVSDQTDKAMNLFNS